MTNHFTPEEAKQAVDTLTAQVHKFVQVIKLYNERITALETQLADLKLSAKPQVVTIKEIPDNAQLEGVDPETVAKYKEGAKTNRLIRDDPKRIALAGHLMSHYTMPTYRLYRHGVLSQSKAIAVSEWDAEFMKAFCEVHGVSDILNGGVSETLFTQMTDNSAKLLAYMKKNKKIFSTTTTE